MDNGQKIWRYMSFSRFVWLLQHKKLWLARADTFADPWEVALTRGQLDFLAARHPIAPIGEPRNETFEERARRITALWRVDTYINCWSASEHESHALWRVFCGPTEGVAIQTTLGKLKTMTDNISVYEVVYGEPANTHTPQQIAQATVKRFAFAYEHEIRVIARRETPNPNLIKFEFGFEYPLNLDIIELVAIHPEADESFHQTVVRTVDDYAPSLRESVQWSTMKEMPPLR